MDELLPVVRGKLWQPDRGEQAQARPTRGRFSREADDWHAHPQSVQCGGDSVVRERIERDVDPVEKAQIFIAWTVVTKLQPMPGDAQRFDGLAKFPPMAAFGREEQQARTRDGGQHLRPQPHHGLIEFAEVVQAAESHEPAALLRLDGRLRMGAHRVVAAPGVRQAHTFLRVNRAIGGRRIHERIGEPIVDGIEAG